MTLTRSFDELELIDLGNVKMEGRERVLRFELNKKNLWEKSKEYMRSPVKKHNIVKQIYEPWPGLIAGLSALSHYSMLGEPRNPVYALSTKQWNTLKKSNVLKKVPVQDYDTCEIEVWNYDPQLFAEDHIVDRLSLYLSLKNTKDERVEAALDHLMDAFEW